jgi:hypothetical protein
MRWQIERFEAMKRQRELKDRKVASAGGGGDGTADIDRGCVSQQRLVVHGGRIKIKRGPVCTSAFLFTRIGDCGGCLMPKTLLRTKARRGRAVE